MASLELIGMHLSRNRQVRHCTAFANYIRRLYLCQVLCDQPSASLKLDDSQAYDFYVELG